MIKRHWRVNPDEADKIHQSDRDQIKTLIVDLMLSSPESIQRQVDHLCHHGLGDWLVDIRAGKKGLGAMKKAEAKVLTESGKRDGIRFSGQSEQIFGKIGTFRMLICLHFGTKMHQNLEYDGWRGAIIS